MKKFIIKLTSAMAICLCAILIINSCAAAKSIYFAGEYKANKKRFPYKLEMNVYSSPEGKKVGNYRFVPIDKAYSGWNGEVKKIGKNKYIEKVPGPAGYTITFKVKKKSVVVKQKKTILRGVNFSGKYKLKKRYPVP